MHITIVAMGTRGDVQPAIALGLGLKQAGHTVRIVAGHNFAEWVQSYGFEFAGILDMETLMKSPDGIIWSESSDNPMRQLRMMRRLLRANCDEMLSTFIHINDTDLFISGFVSEPYTQSLAEKYNIRHISAPLQPYHATRSTAANMQPVTPFDSILNKWMGRLTDWILWWVAKETINKQRTTMMDMPAHTFRSYRRAVNNIPCVFGFSECVVPRPSDWGDHLQVSGFWFLDEQTDWQPSEELTTFLDSGEPPVYVGFGSMSSSDPLTTFNMVCDALESIGQRGIMVRGWSLDRDYDVPSHMCLLDSVPHSWLFQRVKGVVHHGGAGTMAAGLRAGKPTLIIPHMSDQPFWGRRVHQLGVGVKPIMRHKVEVDNLAKSIEALVTDNAIRDAAAKLGERIRAEDGVGKAVELITQANNNL